MTLVNGFEIFLDESYFDMWGVKIPGCRDFNKVLHFHTREEAETYAKNA
jgi:hypothetical protein